MHNPTWNIIKLNPSMYKKDDISQHVGFIAEMQGYFDWESNQWNSTH